MAEGAGFEPPQEKTWSAPLLLPVMLHAGDRRYAGTRRGEADRPSIQPLFPLRAVDQQLVDTIMRFREKFLPSKDLLT